MVDSAPELRTDANIAEGEVCVECMLRFKCTQTDGCLKFDNLTESSRFFRDFDLQVAVTDWELEFEEIFLIFHAVYNVFQLCEGEAEFDQHLIALLYVTLLVLLTFLLTLAAFFNCVGIFMEKVCANHASRHYCSRLRG